MSGSYKCTLFLIFAVCGANCGILTGDLKLKTKPLTINSHHAPVNININTDKLKATFPSLSLPKPAKPPPKLLTDLLKPSLFSSSKLTPLSSKISKLPKLPSLTKSFLPSTLFSKSIFPSKSLFPSKSILSSRKLSRSSIFEDPILPSLESPKLPKLPSLSKSLLPAPKLSPLTKLSVPMIPSVVPPIIPKVPLLPLPLLPPIIPPIPLIPILPPFIPGLPLVPSILSPLGPLRVPILGGKSPLQKALGSELRPVVVNIKEETRNVIMEKKLKNLLRRGSLTVKEFNRFRKLLLG